METLKGPIAMIIDGVERQVYVRTVEFRALKDDWSEFETLGTPKIRVRLRPILVRVSLACDQEGNLIRDKGGEPVTLSSYNTMVASHEV